MLNIFSCDFYPAECLLWRNAYLDLPPIYWLGSLFFDIELYKIFVYFGGKSLVGYFIGKHFLPYWG